MFQRRALILVWIATLAAGADWDDTTKTTDGPKEPSSSTRCQKGVCAGQEYLVFQQMDTEVKCADACFGAKWNSGPGCKYYTYSSETKNCFQYSQCDTVGTAEFTKRGLIYLEVGDITTYKTCKFTKYMKDVWLDLTSAPVRQSSTGWGGNPQRASDGNMASNWGGRSCTHTHRNNKAWWEVTIPVKQTCSDKSPCPERQKCVDGICKAEGLPLKNLGGSGCTSSKKCTACQGDCDRDSDCASGLFCFQRSQSSQLVPGCIEGGSHDIKDHDYCYDPSKAKGVELKDLGGSGCTSRKKCNACEGDCDRDSDCASGLKCFQRSQSSQHVPGCKVGGSGDKNSHDYCYAPEAPTPSPTASRSTGHWTLLLKQDTSKKMFSSGTKNTFKFNENEPNNAEAYMNIGAEDTSLKVDGKYTFKLVYDGSRTIEWSQSSWLTSPNIEGFECISPKDCGPASKTNCAKFEGLGKSGDGSSVLDGNGGKGCWWNSVGTIKKYGSGLPGWNQQVAKKTELYVSSKTPCESKFPGCHECDGENTICRECAPGFRKTEDNICKAQPCTKAADGNDCLNGGTVSGETGTCGCACPSGWGGSNCQTAVQKIDMVRVVNRGDCCERRLQSFKVKVDDVECATSGSTTRGEILDVPCKAEGTKVKIELTGNDYLTLCEVAVKYEEAVDISNEEWFM